MVTTTTSASAAKAAASEYKLPLPRTKLSPWMNTTTDSLGRSGKHSDPIFKIQPSFNTCNGDSSTIRLAKPSWCKCEHKAIQSLMCLRKGEMEGIVLVLCIFLLSKAIAMRVHRKLQTKTNLLFLSWKRERLCHGIENKT